jgi:hypothetical protein
MDFAAWIEVYLGGRWHAFDSAGLSLQIEELQGDFVLQSNANVGSSVRPCPRDCSALARRNLPNCPVSENAALRHQLTILRAIGCS